MATWNYVTDEEYRARFAKLYRVDASGCWIWTGIVGPWGYGWFSYRGIGAAHRASYVFFRGPIPKGRNIRVCHTCDVRLCVNPDHLWIGTQQQNIKDCALKGRHTNGAKTHCRRGHEYTTENTKYTDAGNGRKRRSCATCNRIRQRIESGWSAEEAAAVPPMNAHERGLRSWAKRRAQPA
jgi:hypothetical protein